MYVQRASAALRAALPQAPNKSIRCFKASRYANAGPEPSIHDVLADPIVRLLLARDRLDASEVGAFLEERRDALRDCLCLCQAA
jgi:hypothetical protein